MYDIISFDKEKEKGEYMLRLIPESRIYKAHFPKQPITPGVCLIKMVSELFENMTGCATELQEVVNAKFLSVVDPIVTPEIKLLFKKIEEPQKEVVKVQCLFHKDKTIYTKLSLLFKTTPN